MAPPLPPPGGPGEAGFPPQPIALLFVNTLSSTSHWTLMLLRAPPLEQRPAVKLSSVMWTGRFSYWARARIAPPPRSGPWPQRRLATNRELTAAHRPPSPPPYQHSGTLAVQVA